MTRTKNDLEGRFRSVWSMCGTLDAQAQVKFHDSRNWLFDFAWIDRLIALEIQGGTFVAGAHNRGSKMRDEYQRHNAATLLGWRILYADTDMIMKAPIPLCEQINALLEIPVLFPNAEYAMWQARVRSLTKDGDEISANGITVKRNRLRKYAIRTAQGSFEVKGEFGDVLAFILGK